MLQLPIELRRLCLEALELNAVFPNEVVGEHFVQDGLDQPTTPCSTTLKALRFVNKGLDTLATEHLFRTVILNHTDESVAKLGRVISSTHRTLVRRVIINTGEDPEYSGNGQEEEAEMKESFLQAIMNLKDIENLTEVDLKFARECAVDGHSWAKDFRETADIRMEILDHIWKNLRQVKSLTALTVKNLQDYHEALYQST